MCVITAQSMKAAESPPSLEHVPASLFPLPHAAFLILAVCNALINPRQIDVKTTEKSGKKNSCIVEIVGNDDSYVLICKSVMCLKLNAAVTADIKQNSSTSTQIMIN